MSHFQIPVDTAVLPGVEVESWRNQAVLVGPDSSSLPKFLATSLVRMLRIDEEQYSHTKEQTVGLITEDELLQMRE
jgi:hypothetical protein